MNCHRCLAASRYCRGVSLAFCALSYRVSMNIFIALVSEDLPDFCFVVLCDISRCHVVQDHLDDGLCFSAEIVRLPRVGLQIHIRGFNDAVDMLEASVHILDHGGGTE